MKSKVSFFNRGIFKKNMMKYWLIGVLYTGILFFIMPFQLLNLTSPYFNSYSADKLAALKTQYLAQLLEVGINPILPAVFSIFIALVLFSYLYSPRSCNMFHALPVSRRELFLTNYISGLILLMVPQILIFFLSTFFSMALGISSMEYLVQWILLSLCIAYFFFSMACFCCMLTGNPIAAAVYYVGFNLLFVVCKILIMQTMAMLCYGMSVYDVDLLSTPSYTRIADYLSPIYYLITHVSFDWTTSDSTGTILTGFTGIPVIITYFLVGIILSVLTMQMYRRRQLETAGDVISISWIKPIFRWVCALVLGLGLALLITKIAFSNMDSFPLLFASMLLFGFLAFFTAEMALWKKVRVFTRGRMLEWGTFAILSSLMLISLKMDVFGITTYIPETEDVEEVYLLGDYTMLLTDTEDIEAVQQMHQQIIDNEESFTAYSKSANADDTLISSYITISYNLKNGSIVMRGYHIPASDTQKADSNSVISKLARIEQNVDHFLSNYFCLNYTDISLTGGSITLLADADAEIFDTKNLSADEADALLDALCLDLTEGNLDLTGDTTDKYYYNDLLISFTCPAGIQTIDSVYNFIGSAMIERMDDSEIALSTSGTAYIPVTTECVHLKQALYDLGIEEDQLITFDDYSVPEGEWREIIE